MSFLPAILPCDGESPNMSLICLGLNARIPTIAIDPRMFYQGAIQWVISWSSTNNLKIPVRGFLSKFFAPFHGKKRIRRDKWEAWEDKNKKKFNKKVHKNTSISLMLFFVFLYLLHRSFSKLCQNNPNLKTAIKRTITGHMVAPVHKNTNATLILVLCDVWFFWLQNCPSLHSGQYKDRHSLGSSKNPSKLPIMIFARIKKNLPHN